MQLRSPAPGGMRHLAWATCIYAALARCCLLCMRGWREFKFRWALGNKGLKCLLHVYLSNSNATRQIDRCMRNLRHRHTQLAMRKCWGRRRRCIPSVSAELPTSMLLLARDGALQQLHEI